MYLHSSPQRFPTLNPGGSGCPLVYSERAALPVLLRPAPPGPPACTAERHGSTQRRVLWQRAETAERGVRLCRWDGRPASRLMSWWLMWLTHLSNGWLIEPPTPASQLTEKNLTVVPKRQPLDTALITFMVHTALISSEVQRKKMSMKHLGCCSLFHCRCRNLEPSDTSATFGDTRWQGFSFHVQALTCTVCKC